MDSGVTRYHWLILKV